MKQLDVGIVALAVVGVLAVGPASAGGWAVTTLDSVPRPTANQTVEIGFTIRQHGVTPVNPDGEVGIVLRAPTAEEQFHPAEPSGVVGHYVAEVTFGGEGPSTWAVRQGWFGQQDLGTIDVAPPAGSRTESTSRWLTWARICLPALTGLLAAGAIFDASRNRRRRVVAA